MTDWQKIANDLHLIVMSNPRGDFVVPWKAERSASRWAAGLSRLWVPLWFIHVVGILANHYINTVICTNRRHGFTHFNQEWDNRKFWPGTAYAEVQV